MEQKDSQARKLLEASAWRVRLSETDAEEGEHPGFQEWIAADPRNADAWRQVTGPWRLFGDHATAPEVIVARREALARAEQAGRRRWREAARSGNHALQAIAATVVVVLGLAFLFAQIARPDVYNTGFGERRVVSLDDGSMLSLDAQSEVRVHYRSHVRELQLVRGQAKFDVAHDAERPFTVLAGGRKVIATGTSFNVDMLGAKLFVTLIEGRVVVLPSPERRPSDGQRIERIELMPGKQLALAEHESPAITDVNVGLAMAWQTGLIAFEDATLAEAVARLNRYSENKLIVDDETAGNIRISGVFKAGDMSGFVSTITTYFPVSAAPQSGGEIRITRRLN